MGRPHSGLAGLGHDRQDPGQTVQSHGATAQAPSRQGCISRTRQPNFADRTCIFFFFHFCCPQSREVPHPTFQAPPAFAVCPQALALRFQVHSQPAGAFCRVCSQPASESPGTWEITSLPDSEFPVLGHSSTVLFSSPPCPSLRFPLFRVSLPSYSSPQLTGTPG